jgi:RimJ/RimL family protein N-acetyltransferase
MKPFLPTLPTCIETERLFLRPYELGDGSWYYQMSQRNKSHLARYESGNAVMRINSQQDAEQVVREFEASWIAGSAFFLGAFRKDSAEFVAQIYIGVVNLDLPEFEIGYFADVDQSGKGYVTEATETAVFFVFEQLGAYRIRLECDDTNLSSSRVAERCRFVKEGHIRENRKNVDGSFSGTLYYGLLRRECNLQLP